MAFAPFTCALGDSPEVELQAGTEVDIATPDVPGGFNEPEFVNAVDTNRVRVVGTGTIESLGLACGGQVGEVGEPRTVTKRIAWVPDAPGITLINSPQLRLLGNADRTIITPAYGRYVSDVDGNWQEEGFTRGDVPPPDSTKSGGLIALVPYTTSGPITIPPYATRAWVRMWGGTGATVVAQPGGPSVYCSPGTGSAGYLEKFLTGLVPGKTLMHTHGAPGAPAGYPNPGGNGGDSILASGTQTIGTLTAHGTLGTPIGVGGLTRGTPGGTATGGDLNVTGQAGGLGGGELPGIGAAFNMSRGADGTTSTTSGNPGQPGGMIIAWFNDVT